MENEENKTVHPSPGGSGNEQSNKETKQPDNQKVFAILGYVVPLLFFLPLVTDLKNNVFSKYHANQQLNLLLLLVLANAFASVLATGIVGFSLFQLVWIAWLVFMVLGILNVVNGKQQPLPLIGGFHLIK